MLFPRTHAWTPLQKWLIMGAGVMALMCFGILVYTYELHHRGPSESVFFGVWETDGLMSDDPCIYVEFKADHNFSMSSSPTMDAETVFITGRWYAGGPNMYVRLPPSWTGESSHRQWVWRIMDIKPDEFRVLMHDVDVHIYRRVHLPPSSASNQTMQRTPKAFGVADLGSR